MIVASVLGKDGDLSQFFVGKPSLELPGVFNQPFSRASGGIHSHIESLNGQDGAKGVVPNLARDSKS